MKTWKRVYIEIGNACNLNCDFCKRSGREKRLMSVSEFESVLSQLKVYRPQLYFHVLGEPLLHPNLPEFLAVAERDGFAVNITTNGTLLADKGCALIKSEAVRQINISVHSFFEQRKNAAYLRTVSVFGKAAQHVGKFVSYRLWNGENGIMNEATELVVKELCAAFGVAFGTVGMGRNAVQLADRVYISFENSFLWPEPGGEDVAVRGKCLGGREMLGILSDGTVVPCCLDADGDVPLGNLFTQKLDDILASERYSKLCAGFSGGRISESLCRKCTYRLRFDSKDRRDDERCNS